MSSNLPPGCSESDIPGNRPEDIAFDTFVEELAASGCSTEELRVRFTLGAMRIAGEKLSVDEVVKRIARSEYTGEHVSKLWFVKLRSVEKVGRLLFFAYVETNPKTGKRELILPGHHSTVIEWLVEIFVPECLDEFFAP